MGLGVGGVLFQLKLRGLFGPYCFCCAGKGGGEDDVTARQALTTLNHSCRRIQVHTPTSSSSSSSSNASGMGFLGSFFGSSSGGATSSPRASVTSPTSSYLAQLVLRDSFIDGQPEIVIEQPLQARSTANDSDTDDAAYYDTTEEPVDEPSIPTSDTKQARKRTTRSIKLRRVDKVLLDGDAIVLQSKASTSSTAVSIPSRELLRFVVLQPQQQGLESAVASSNPLFVTPDTRNLLVHHFMVLTEWERQRRAVLIKTDGSADDDDDDDDDDDETLHHHPATSNFLTARAHQIAHRAQREIELQRTQRQREQRKAQLLKEVGGGLKYTALAMAQNAAATASASSSTTTNR